MDFDVDGQAKDGIAHIVIATTATNTTGVPFIFCVLLPLRPTTCEGEGTLLGLAVKEYAYLPKKCTRFTGLFVFSLRFSGFCRFGLAIAV